jgi:hypothetical protein
MVLLSNEDCVRIEAAASVLFKQTFENDEAGKEQS